MKKFLSAALLVLGLAACKEVPPITNVGWTPVIDESALGDAPTPDVYKVTLTNVGTEEVVTGDFDKSAPAEFRLVPGIYNVVIQAHGSLGGRAFNYIGSANAVSITGKEESYDPIKIEASVSSALVFKEIHYNACKLIGKTTPYLKDTFFEIYNNSDETVYADGICLGDPLSCKVYDFSDKLENAAECVFIGTYVWQVAGNGHDYPIAPGESFIIAASAIDHSQTAETLDLSTAEFETICEKYINKGGQTDANAVNMTLACTIKESALGNQFGKFIDGAWCLFYPSRPLRKDGEYIESNHANNYGLDILKADVLDAVDCLKTENPEDKRLENVLDAGWIKCNPTGGNQSIVRKVAKTLEDGRIVLQDTNNTTEDFEVNDSPQIRRYGVKRPSWSSWTTAQ